MAFVVLPLSIIACPTSEADPPFSMSLTLNKLARVMAVEEKMQFVPLTQVPEVSSSTMLCGKRKPEIRSKAFQKDRNPQVWG